MQHGRGELRWLVGTALVVAVLLGISALALDRPNVVWLRAQPHCPACREAVPPYSRKCKTCRTDFDWVLAPDEESPLATHSMSPYEEQVLRDRVAALGRPETVRRIADALGIPEAGAEAWLDAIGRGRCGLCGGTGLDLIEVEDDAECDLCFGGGSSIEGGEDRRVRLGDYKAELALAAYEAEIAELGAGIPPVVRRQELRRQTREFLRSYAGTAQAGEVRWWRALAEAPEAQAPLAVDEGRRRLDAVLAALAVD